MEREGERAQEKEKERESVADRDKDHSIVHTCARSLCITSFNISCVTSLFITR